MLKNYSMYMYQVLLNVPCTLVQHKYRVTHKPLKNYSMYMYQVLLNVPFTLVQHKYKITHKSDSGLPTKDVLTYDNLRRFLFQFIQKYNFVEPNYDAIKRKSVLLKQTMNTRYETTK